jgi:thymidylate synthase
MIYTRPWMHEDYNKDGMSDFICTNTVQYLIRDGKVHALVYMRSNDAVFGYKNDYAWQLYVLYSVAAEVGMPVGDIYWNVASLHIYERHFKLVEDYDKA